MSASKFAIAAAVVLIGSTACLAPAVTHAQQSAPASASGDATAMPSFEQLDKAHRGYISRGDIPKDVDSLKPLRMHFAESDTNSNGRLDKAEYEAYVARSQPAQGAGGSGQSPAQPMQH